MDILKLVASLEAASEGSEYLDYAIQRQFSLMKPVPPYTSSVDAAMSLLPEGWSIHRLCHRHDCRGSFTSWFAELYRAQGAEFPPECRDADYEKRIPDSLKTTLNFPGYSRPGADRGDKLTEMKHEYLAAGGYPENRRYGWVRK